MKIINSLALLLFAITLLTSCGQTEKKSTESAEVPLVEVTTIKSMQPSMEVILPGELKPWNKAHLFAKVKGYVGVVYVDRGSLV